jgi:hypothetical protein
VRKKIFSDPMPSSAGSPKTTLWQKWWAEQGTTSATSIAGESYAGHQDIGRRNWNALPVDAVFVAVSERPIFAGQSQRESEDTLLDKSLFPSTDGSDATDKLVDFIPAESLG